MLFVHASVHAPYDWNYVYERQAAHDSLCAAGAWSGARYIFCGHAHVQALFCQGGDKENPRTQTVRIAADVALSLASQKKWHTSVGSVGQPRDGNPHAMYVLFDVPDASSSDPAEITFCRVPYDYSAAADTIRRAGLNDFFADRLEEGR